MKKLRDLSSFSDDLDRFFFLSFFLDPGFFTSSIAVSFHAVLHPSLFAARQGRGTTADHRSALLSHIET